MSKELSPNLMNLRVVMTHSAPYHQQENNQWKKENSIIWKTVRMALKSLAALNQWESVLDNVL